jgi:NAD(P)-dependent dehydrogenase (short-subunit alcohol dehydrogenase family)
MDYHSIQPRYPELRDRVAIVTGSGRGIGQGIALRLAREGMKVIINDRDAEPAHDTAAQLQRLGAAATAIPADISKPDEIDRLIDTTVRELGAIDLVVNNAADLRRKNVLELDQKLWDEQFDVNIRGPFLLALGAARIMRRHGRGCIVNISTVGGLRAHQPGLPYDATKAALDALTRSLGIELAEFGIRVNGVAPGAMLTQRTPPRDDPHTQGRMALIPARRLGLPADIAAAVAFLASDEGSYIIGQTIYVDGGVTIQLSPPEHQV